jgi:moderate conductance mechanosensitive channel
MDWSGVIDWLTTHGWRILLIILISLAVYFAMRHFVPLVVGRTVAGTMKRKPKSAIKKRTDTLSGVFIQTGLVLIVTVAVFMILSELKINVAPALAGLGIAGIAIGFGAQHLVKDLFNGTLILLENQYGVGDVVKIAGITGTVEEVDLRRTVLRDLDGIVHTVPNGDISVASNYTKERSRINMNISVGYGEDLSRVIGVINRIGNELAEDPDWAPRISQPPQVLRVDAFEDSGIAIKILGETKPMEQWAAMGELRLRLKKVFDEEGIEIPWPHTKIFFGNGIPEGEVKETPVPALPADSSTEQKQEVKKRKKTTILPDGEDGGD